MIYIPMVSPKYKDEGRQNPSQKSVYILYWKLNTMWNKINVSFYVTENQ